MSFIKKAVKKVFKVVKKVVKSKIFKIIAIAAIIFFTAGIAAGGFAAFAGVNSVGTFFVAAGQTMATGAAAMAGAVGLQGTSAALAAHGGAAATAAGLAGAPGIAAAGGTVLASAAPGVITAETLANTALGVEGIAASTAGVSATGTIGGVAAGSGVTTALAAPVQSGGVWSAIGNVFGKKVLGDVTLGQVVTNGVIAGVTNIINQKGKEKQFPNGFVAGGLARGGPEETPDPYSFEFAGASAGDPGTTIDASDPTVAAQLAQQEGGPVDVAPEGPPVVGTGIRDQIAQRGGVASPPAGAQPLGQDQGLIQRQPLVPEQPAQGLVGSPFQDQPRRIAGLV